MKKIHWSVKAKAFLSGTSRVLMHVYALAALVLLLRLIVDIDAFIEDNIEFHEAAYKIGVLMIKALHGGGT
jgi:hypothetical protein